ncbi:MAG: hypothetical protein GVX78_04475 [Bacteroidetes bacterium]|jgi:hypothetical protein|nr:hypothetical protein [Bacteroidota bacterium]
MSEQKANLALSIGPSFVLFASICSILLLVEQDQFYSLLIFYTAAFLSFILIYFKMPACGIKWLWFLAIAIRCVSFLEAPKLSDDYYRFYWDAKISSTDTSVYAYTPTEWKEITNDPVLADIYPKLNSPDYYSVYPPFLQAIYSAAYNLSSGSLHSFVFWLRLIFFLSEMAGLYLLFRWGKNQRNGLLYALNPLIIVELMGNLHAEVFVAVGIILFFISAKLKSHLSVLGVMLAVGAKLSPIILFPSYYLANTNRITWTLLASMLLLLVLFLYPLWWDVTALHHFLSSIRLYYQTFEFNGSLYVLTREIFKVTHGYNLIFWIGPALQLIAACVMAFIYYLVYRKKITNLSFSVCAIWLVYLLCSTTVHPWYIIPLIALSPFNQSVAITAWSYSIIFSYIYYSNQHVAIQSLFHTLEYLILLGGMIYEYKKPISI